MSSKDRSNSKIVGNPDKISFTSYTGEKEMKDWNLFDLDDVRFQVRNRIITHNAYTYALNELPVNEKFDSWYTNMYNHEKMICNYSYLGDDFPQYEFDIKEIDVHKLYRPVYKDEHLLKTNSFIYPYDEGIISLKEYNDTCYHYLKDNFPDEYKTQAQIVSELSQSQVDDMLDRCLQNFNYPLTMDEVAYGSNKEYAKKVSRWLDKKFKQFRIDKDTHFNRFEISLRNNPQPTHALANGFNPQLHTLPTDNDIERGKSKVPNIHPIILEYLENRFRDWFIKKYKSLGDDMNVESIILEGINHFYTGQTRQEVKFVKPK